MIGGALWWFGFDGASIAAAAASTTMMTMGASLSESKLSLGSPTTQETGRNMFAVGLGSAIGYFGFSDSGAGYFIGAGAGFLLSAVPNMINRQATRPNPRP